MRELAIDYDRRSSVRGGCERRKLSEFWWRRMRNRTESGGEAGWA